MRTRRELLLALGAGLVAAPSRSFAQKASKVWRVGILAPSRRPGIYEALTQGLRDLGYIEGKNLVMEYRIAEGDYARLAELAARLVALQVDVIMTDATPGALAAQKATKVIPIVFQVGDPVGNGLVKSLARPGGNSTGMSVFTKEISVKQMEVLAGAVPGLSRLGVLWNPDNPSHAANLEGLRASAKKTGLEIISLEARTPQEIEGAFSQMAQEAAGAFIWVADPFFNQQIRQIAGLAMKQRLPSIALNPAYVEAGGFLSYGADPRVNWRRLATTVDKIFKGANPGDLPVEQPTKLDLVINRKTAKALGLAIPAELLLLASKVIE